MTTNKASASNPYDGTAAVLVPQNIEKLLLYHWRPGSRALSVGSRDGARFDGVLPDDERRTFRRAIDPDLITQVGQQLSLSTWAATWTCSLAYRQGLRALLASELGDGVIQTAGYGESTFVELLLDTPQVSAWSLLVDVACGVSELAQMIVSHAPHIEIVLGLSSAAEVHAKLAILDRLDWDRVSAVHLQPIRPSLAVGEQLHLWEDAVRNVLPKGLVIYDSRRQTTHCQSCQADLVWRSSGRSRLAAIQPGRSQCLQCGQMSLVRW